MSFEDRLEMMRKLYDRGNDIASLECEGVQGAEKGIVAKEIFMEEFSDIAGNDKLMKAACIMDRVQLGEEDYREPLTRYRENGSNLRGLSETLISAASPEQIAASAMGKSVADVLEGLNK